MEINCSIFSKILINIHVKMAICIPFFIFQGTQLGFSSQINTALNIYKLASESPFFVHMYIKLQFNLHSFKLTSIDQKKVELKDQNPLLTTVSEKDMKDKRTRRKKQYSAVSTVKKHLTARDIFQNDIIHYSFDSAKENCLWNISSYFSQCF